MSDIYSSKLLDLLPPNLRGDPDIIAASEAVDSEFQALTSSIKNVLTFADIDNASSEVVDNLAWELNTDFYDSSFTLAKRREMVKNALINHFTKGTASAVERVVTDAFDEAEVQEWFEYGGEPYFFKVTTTDSVTTTDKLQNLIKAINAVKNIRSWLEVINILRENRGVQYIGVANLQKKHQIIACQKYVGTTVSVLGVTFERS